MPPWLATAAQPPGSIEIVLPSAFPLSNSAQVADTGSYSGPVAGSIRVVSAGQSRYLEIPGAPANGSRLVTLADQERGITIQNNTLVAPVFQGSRQVGRLVLATDDLAAGPDGYFGRITGVELDTAPLAREAGGGNFSTTAAIFLAALNPGATFLVSVEAEPADTRGLPVQDIALTINVSGTTPEAGESIEFAIVSVAVDPGWIAGRGADNVTLYQLREDNATTQESRIFAAEGGQTVIQSVLPGGGTLVLAAPATGTDSSLAATAETAVDALVFGGLLLVLGAGLVIMIRRVTRK